MSLLTWRRWPHELRRTTADNRDVARHRTPANLEVLLRERYQFLGEHIKPGDTVLEVGAGIGITSDYLPGVTLCRTDVEPNDWIDAVVSGEALAFRDSCFDAVVCFAALHHMHHPLAAVHEMARVVRPGGKLLIVEVHASWLLRLTLSMTRHEYIDVAIDPFSGQSCQTREGNHWNGNNAIGDRLFLDRVRFAAAVPQLELIHHRFTEALIFINSGGVNVKVPYIPLPKIVLKTIAAVDRLLCRVAPNIFAICQEIVLRRKAY